MGIDLTCDTKYFSCSYSGWNSARTELIEATFFYLEDLIDKQTNDMVNDEYKNAFFNNLKKYINDIRQYRDSNNCLLFGFIETSKNLNFINLLIQFGVGGIYALCNKSDCEGFYSVGNSCDICQLIKLIKPFLLKNKDDVDNQNLLYNSIDRLLEVFQDSVETNIIVSIT